MLNSIYNFKDYFKDLIVLTSDSGCLSILWYSLELNSFQTIANFQFGRPGCLLEVPGQYCSVNSDNKLIAIGLYLVNYVTLRRTRWSSPSICTWAFHKLRHKRDSVCREGATSLHLYRLHHRFDEVVLIDGAGMSLYGSSFPIEIRSFPLRFPFVLHPFPRKHDRSPISGIAPHHRSVLL